jgi:hypothetical protein
VNASAHLALGRLLALHAFIYTSFSNGQIAQEIRNAPNNRYICNHNDNDNDINNHTNRRNNLQPRHNGNG